MVMRDEHPIVLDTSVWIAERLLEPTRCLFNLMFWLEEDSTGMNSNTLEAGWIVVRPKIRRRRTSFDLVRSLSLEQ